MNYGPDFAREFRFGSYSCRIEVVNTWRQLDLGKPEEFRGGAALVCDEHTASLAENLSIPADKVARIVLPAGEAAKEWSAVERVIEGAFRVGLGRDGVIIGVGGGVVTDLAAFAASVYMRGTRLVLVPTTLLAMVDAAIGGKTGFDLFGVKNLVGTFRPADAVLMPIEALRTLPRREWLSGMAEVLKTAVLGDEELLDRLEREAAALAGSTGQASSDTLIDLVRRCAIVKGRIVENDPTETGSERALLNLGHTFGHALEAVAGLGTLTHGEAVAWGMARACALGRMLGRTPPDRAERVLALLDRFGYSTAPLHPAAVSAFGGNRDKAAAALIAAMGSDKKKKEGELRFIVPAATSAEIVSAGDASMLDSLFRGGIH